jgi:hypothetical protein
LLADGAALERITLLSAVGAAGLEGQSLDRRGQGCRHMFQYVLFEIENMVFFNGSLTKSGLLEAGFCLSHQKKTKTENLFSVHWVNSSFACQS